MLNFWRLELLTFLVVSDSKGVFLFGYSGHAYVVIESILELGLEIRGYFDLSEAKKNPYSLQYLGSENQGEIKEIINNDFVFPCVGDNRIRQKLVNLFDHLGLNQFVVQDPSASVSRTAIIGSSTYVGKGVVINAFVEVGKGVILNSGSVIEHECRIESYSHVAPGSILCGNVTVGSLSFIGANSVVRQNTKITDNIIIGAGSVVVKDVLEKGVWVGNKLKRI